MTPDTAVLAADAGRPDARELSRVVAVRLLARAGISTDASAEFAPTGSVTRTPATAEELVPGDATGLARAAEAWAEWGASAPPEIAGLAAEVAEAHAALAPALTALRAEADAVFAEARGHGVPAEVLCHAERAASFIATRPLRAQPARELAERAASVRVAWVQATSDFVDALAGVRQAVGIADW